MTENPPNIYDAAEMLWVVVANVSGGDWTQQSAEWQEAAARWRDYYFAVAKTLPKPTDPPQVGCRVIPQAFNVTPEPEPFISGGPNPLPTDQLSNRAMTDRLVILTASTNCPHEWVLPGVMMPEGYWKPTGPISCRWCGAWQKVEIKLTVYGEPQMPKDWPLAESERLRQ